MGINGFFKRIFNKRHRSKHFQITVTFKTELEQESGSAWILKSEPVMVDDTWCYSFRNMLSHEVLSVTFLDQYDKHTMKTYPCTMKYDNRAVFINNPTDPQEYGKILIIVPKIEIVGDKKLLVLAEVGNFEKTPSGAYRDVSLIGKTVKFDIKYRKIDKED